jgi:hypothetical protein
VLLSRHGVSELPNCHTVFISKFMYIPGFGSRLEGGEKLSENQIGCGFIDVIYGFCNVTRTVCCYALGGSRGMARFRG